MSENPWPRSALIGEPRRALLEDRRDPIERFDVVDERRAAENADLGDIGRAMTGQATLAFDRSRSSRDLLAADVGAGAAAEMTLVCLREARASSLASSCARISRAAGYSSRM